MVWKNLVMLCVAILLCAAPAKAKTLEELWDFKLDTSYDKMSKAAKQAYAEGLKAGYNEGLREGQKLVLKELKDLPDDFYLKMYGELTEQQIIASFSVKSFLDWCFAEKNAPDVHIYHILKIANELNMSKAKKYLLTQQEYAEKDKEER